MNHPSLFAEILLPLPVPGTFSYRVPEALENRVIQGIRVVVPFGRRKIYAGLAVRVHRTPPEGYEAKEILNLLDEVPVVTPTQFRFWEWMAAYYLCHEGEVMNAALPAAFRLASESRIVLNDLQRIDFSVLNEKEQLLAEALLYRKAIVLEEAAKILDQRKYLPVVNNLLEKGIIRLEEEIRERYHRKKEVFVRLHPGYENETRGRELFDSLEKKAKKQLDLLMSYILLSRQDPAAKGEIPKSALLKSAHVSPSILDSMVKKKIFLLIDKTVSRLDHTEAGNHPDEIRLSRLQQKARDEIVAAFGEKEVVLLHGVTSSGKTEIYIRLIQETIEKGKQALYLLPEIALTAQIINRLKKYFGDRVGVYHSRFSENERVEIWNQVLRHDPGERKYDIILGARSAVFLPFTDLGLVIVDEEHDSSFKQYEPAPRYNGRDAALYLAHLHGASALLGTATPSIETYFNAREGKYALVELMERYGNMELPGVVVADVRSELRWKRMRSHFTSVLMEQLEKALAAGEQSILFQNRRGFSPRLECDTCHWMPSCRNCDVTLVYHKQNNQLRCHYCGYISRIPEKCPECRGTAIRMKGFGTEKVEEELKIFFPEATIIRMDLDTTRSRHSYQKIIQDFEENRIDILVGTQMVTKGLDFSNVSTVCILSADNMLSFPDFRSAERSYQLMAQVSGRAGRKYRKGKVIIQTYQPSHPVIRYVVNHDYTGFYEDQLADRRKFHYPPWYRLIHLKVRHRDTGVLSKAADDLGTKLKEVFGKRVLGPEYPVVARIQNYYIKQLLVKIDRQESVSALKRSLTEVLEQFMKEKRYSGIRLTVDVDPQ